MKKPIHDYYGAGTPTMTEVRCDRCGADAEHEIEGEDLCAGCKEIVDEVDRKRERYDPTNESLAAKVQAGEWVSRHELVLDPAIQGAERTKLLDQRAAYLRGDWLAIQRAAKRSA